MSRYTPEFNAYARRVVKSFNQRVMRAQKRGLKNLPSIRRVRELKAMFTTEDDLKKELESLRAFNQNRDALKYKELKGEARITNWEYDYIQDNLQELRAYYDRELEKARQRYADDSFDMKLREDVLNLETRRDYLNRDLLELDKSELRTYRKYLNLYKNRNRTDVNFYGYYYDSLDFLMRVSGVDKSKIDHIKKSINSLNPAQFYDFYKEHMELKNILDHVPSPDRAKYYSKLREYEEQKEDGMAEEYGVDAEAVIDKINVIDANIDNWVEKAKRNAG